MELLERGRVPGDAGGGAELYLPGCPGRERAERSRGAGAPIV